MSKISQSTDNKELSKYSNSDRVPNLVHISEKYPELEQIITAWPKLTEHIKALIQSYN